MKHQTIIKANQKWFHFPWREIWDYRDLLINFANPVWNSR